MTTGGRYDTLDDFCNFLNWRKTVNLDPDSSLLKKLVKAIPDAIIQSRAFSAFDEGLRSRYDTKVDEWERQVSEWELDNKKLCPYDRPERVITISKVKKRLVEDDHKREVGEENTKQTTASAMIIEALEIEDAQRQLRHAASVTKLTIVQETNLLSRRTSLLNRIRRFHQTQLLHIPALASHMPTLTEDEADKPENIKLLLPSRLSETIRLVICSKEIIELEDQLRYAQAHECLGNITDLLCARSIAYRNSSRVTPSQGAYTKARGLRDQIEAKIKSNRDRYCTAREALLALRGTGDWERILRVLKPEDIRGMNERLLRDEEMAIYREDQLRAGVSASHINGILSGEADNIPTIEDDGLLSKNTSPSWIWFFGREEAEAGDQIHQIEASLRVEWCKARARAQRSREELQLLNEEMRRAISFCDWRSKWWKEQIGRRESVSSWLAEGLMAYANEQADMESERSALWAATWHPLRQHVDAIVKMLDHPGGDLDSMLVKLKTLTVEVGLEDVEPCDFDKFD
ncbi:hypothetical protein WG66_005266 [Moniliophthora roreri]|nr:hypothetical protein WG66_005266 [Moniliophthora roreri]